VLGFVVGALGVVFVVVLGLGLDLNPDPLYPPLLKPPLLKPPPFIEGPSVISVSSEGFTAGSVGRREGSRGIGSTSPTGAATELCVDIVVVGDVGSEASDKCPGIETGSAATPPVNADASTTSTAGTAFRICFATRKLFLTMTRDSNDIPSPKIELQM
jgi:hypothetical protein